MLKNYQEYKTTCIGLIILIRGKSFFYEGSVITGTGSTIDEMLSNDLSNILKILSFLTGLLILILR